MKKGFTLIELIVVIGVILIISAVTILNYNSYTDKQRIKQSGLTLRSDLRLARTKATSGQKTSVCNDTTVLESYDVQFIADCAGKGSCYETKPVCYDSITGFFKNTNDELTRVFLPTGVTFGGVYPTIRFSTVTGVTDLVSDQGIVLAGFGVTYSVRVTSSGVISDY